MKDAKHKHSQGRIKCIGQLVFSWYRLIVSQWTVRDTKHVVFQGRLRWRGHVKAGKYSILRFFFNMVTPVQCYCLISSIYEVLDTRYVYLTQIDWYCRSSLDYNILSFFSQLLCQHHNCFNGGICILKHNLSYWLFSSQTKENVTKKLPLEKISVSVWQYAEIWKRTKLEKPDSLK